MKARELIDRDLAREQIAHVVAIGGPALKAAIDESLRGFERCLTTATGGEYNWGILLPLHQACELADGVEVLLRESCVVAAAPLLRGMLEADVGIRWVLAADTEVRGLAYVVADLRRGLAYFQRMDPNTPAGKRLASELRGSGEAIARLSTAHVRSKAADIEALLSKSPHKAINDAFTSATGSPTKVRAWYEGAGGPSHIRDVCKAVHRLSDYEVMYRTWSSTGHSHDVERIVSSGPGPRDVEISVVRSPVNLPLAYTFAIGLLLDSVKHVLDYYRPGEARATADWYRTHVQGAMTELQRLQERTEYGDETMDEENLG